MRETPLLILGLGNVLCGDDGAGVAAVSRLLERYEPPEGVEVLDGGTLGLTLMPWLESACAVILVDAVAADAPPGALVRLEDDDVPAAALQRLSPHQVGVADLLQGLHLTGGVPERLVLLGVVPASMELEIGCSPPVSAALDALVSAVVSEAADLGFVLRKREVPIPAPAEARRLGI